MDGKMEQRVKKGKEDELEYLCRPVSGCANTVK